MPEPTKNEHAQALAFKKNGAMTKEQRSEQGRKMAQARWQGAGRKPQDYIWGVVDIGTSMLLFSHPKRSECLAWKRRTRPPGVIGIGMLSVYRPPAKQGEGSE